MKNSCVPMRRKILSMVLLKHINSLFELPKELIYNDLGQAGFVLENSFITFFLDIPY